MTDISSTPPVLKNIFVGLLTVLFLGASVMITFFTIFLVVVDGSEETRQEREWCAEFVPEATHSECYAKMGW